jgi:hypothetical protein
MSAEVVRTALPVGAIAVTYQITIGEGRTIAYETAVDSTVDRPELDEILDLVGGAAERRQAIFELPLQKASLRANRELLDLQHKAKRRAEADVSAREAVRGRGGRSVEPKPSDVNAIAQFDERIAKIQAQIKLAEQQIPYLEALIAREEPPELFPELREAAE